jgi:hypothetical protein
MSGVLGSLVGGSATVGTTWVTQRTLGKRELLRMEINRREALYGASSTNAQRACLTHLTII